jgi:hypothetical protein
MTPKPSYLRANPKRLQKRKPVTVCVAAIAQKNTLIGICDRMLTAGDVEFEPKQAKMWLLSPSIVALVSGDSGIQAELLKQVNIQVMKWIVAEAGSWVNRSKSLLP